ncbi:hypothetical protein FHR84_004182 [Actinopolyspora biskrensis]|uniref:HTTM-like domain-containing protein n=1 Tax=Actinopolyspora biskrensis TaxID=1470178 RepID=A0A852Z0M3_9ACTN|nr:hypothetical protein [Actinopolyspora biskrensis]NYH80814.1 hypothetical protein [Actinopolyspora biskrensis]
MIPGASDLVRAALSGLSRPGWKSGRTGGTPPAARESTSGEHRALAWSERLSAVNHLVSSLEYLSNGRDRARGGLNNWEVLRERDPRDHEALRRLYDAVGGERGTRALHALRVLAAGVLLSPVRGRRVRLVATALTAGSSRLLHPRHQYGSDGSDQLAFLVQTTCGLARAGQRDPRAVRSCLRSLAAQVSLAYLVSGVVKLSGPAWRNGGALPGVLRTRTYGDSTAYAWSTLLPSLTRLVELGVVALECGFCAVFAGRGRHAGALLAAGTVFHLVTARVMGLGRFFWAFVGTYPAVWWVARSDDGWRLPFGTGASGASVRRRAGPLGIALSVWLLLTLLCQLPYRAFDRLRALDRSGLLIPDWRFFAPEPARHDFRLAYRFAGRDGAWSAWMPEPAARARSAGHAVWFPRRREDKALFDVCSELLGAVEHGRDERLTETPVFRLLADRVRRRIAETEHIGAPDGFRFRIEQCPGYGFGGARTRYVSPVLDGGARGEVFEGFRERR